ncbi:MAG: lipoyl synthase [Candidatus Omnitrophica bacterium]|nr:lipoyl synthase [Candidatus Omnitrophota bacterium]MDD5592029.1 lipoyl synthase [Candidatus Omnitrophota bacterium]
MNPALPKINELNISRKSGVKNRLPAWFRQDIPDAEAKAGMRLFSGLNVHTVCQEARCPNLSRCFKNLEFTFMILGDTCTRDCRFCAVTKTSKKTLPIDQNEPGKVGRIIKLLDLSYVVITSVTRDDLNDGGAGEFARTIGLIRRINKNTKIEALIPDFSGHFDSLKTVIMSKPAVLAHNLETISRLYPQLRPQAGYLRSLELLARIKSVNRALITKSSLMLGLGETEEEIIEAMADLRYCQCDILTLGQYLAPSKEHYPVQEFINIEQFRRYKEVGLDLGFKAVLSGPKVRSSYQAGKIYNELALLHNNGQLPISNVK